MRCGKGYPAEFIRDSAGVPRCSCGGIVKPEVVLYEEPLDETVVREAIQYISWADTMIVAGTSLTVWPAAGMLQYFHGRRLAVINLEATTADNGADLVLHEPVGWAMQALVL